MKNKSRFLQCTSVLSIYSVFNKVLLSSEELPFIANLTAPAG